MGGVLVFFIRVLPHGLDGRVRTVTCYSRLLWRRGIATGRRYLRRYYERALRHANVGLGRLLQFERTLRHVRYGQEFWRAVITSAWRFYLPLGACVCNVSGD